MFGWLFKKPSEIREELRRKREEERQRRAEDRKPRSYDAMTGMPVDTDGDFAMAAAMGGQLYYESVVAPALSHTPSVDVSSPTTAPDVACVVTDTITTCAPVVDTTPSYSSPPPVSYDTSPPATYDTSPPASYDAGSYSSPPASFDSSW